MAIHTRPEPSWRIREVKRRLLWIFVDPGAKRRIFIVLVAFGLGASLSWYYHQKVMAFLLLPAAGHLSATGRPVFTAPADMFGVKVQLAVRSGIVVAFPVLAYHIARFVSPLLNTKQNRFIALFLPAGFMSYLIGASFAYFILLPTGLKYLLGFSAGVADPMIRITDYLALVYAMLFWLGIVFELPIAMFLLARFRIVSHQRFRKLRRYVPAAAFFLGAVITPTSDLINWALVTVPILLLFEVGAFLAWLARPKQRTVR